MKPQVDRVEFGNRLALLARAVKKMPNDQFDKLIKGNPSLVTVAEKWGDAEKQAANGKRAARPFPALDARKRDSIAAELDAAATRESGARIVQNAFPRKDELFAFAKFLDLPVQKNDNMDRIRRKIVEFTVGRRLDSEAVRGGYAVK